MFSHMALHCRKCQKLYQFHTIYKTSLFVFGMTLLDSDKVWPCLLTNRAILSLHYSGLSVVKHANKKKNYCPSVTNFKLMTEQVACRLNPNDKQPQTNSGFGS